MNFRKSALSDDVLHAFGIKSPDTLGQDFKVLNRVPMTLNLSDSGIGFTTINFILPYACDSDKTFVVLDLETTGFSAETDEIIEIGILRGRFSEEKGCITALDSVLCMLQEPSKPLLPIITEVTGLTDDALKGQAIDDAQVRAMLEGVDLIIAHNAQFDRSFFDQRYPEFKHSLWACSSKGGDIDWKADGHKSAALESLLMDYGYFFDAHRASIDCMATAWLLLSAQAKFAELLHSIKQPRYLVKANKAPFDVKDKLKGYGFKWDGGDKVWYSEIKSDEALRSTLTFMGELYPYGDTLAQVITISPALRHTKR